MSTQEYGFKIEKDNINISALFICKENSLLVCFKDRPNNHVEVTMPYSEFESFCDQFTKAKTLCRPS